MRYLWAPMYSWWVFDGVMTKFTWRNDQVGRRSAKVAALMIYIALTIFSLESKGSRKVRITYNKLSELTGISRELIREGTLVLESFQLIQVERVGRNNEYTLLNNKDGGGWCKIPVRKIMDEDGTSIMPFSSLKMRTKVELHALKIFIYLAAIRDNNYEYSMASYEKIKQNVGMSENDITKALTLLVLIGLIARIEKDKDSDSKKSLPNKYYITGYKGFFRRV